jgi:hypothetical protein
VCGLAHFFEDEGIATTSIALIREHAVTIRAPRALWVPFDLGRPFGAPDEPAFQRRVLLTALELLESGQGPVVLADFPDDAPGPKAEDSTGWVCPVNFAPPPGNDEGPAAALLREIGELAPWYQLSCDRRHRTTVGVSGLKMPVAAAFVASFLDQIPADNPRPGSPPSAVFKDCCSDIMAYYMEAGTAKPGRRSAMDVQNWFWRDTAAGRVFLDVREILRRGDDAKLRFVAERILLPKTQIG